MRDKIRPAVDDLLEVADKTEDDVLHALIHQIVRVEIFRILKCLFLFSKSILLWVQNSMNLFLYLLKEDWQKELFLSLLHGVLLDGSSN